MEYSTYVNLTNYDTPAAALAAKPNDGDTWLLNEPQVFQDARMPKAGPASVKNNQQTQKAKTLTPTINRNKGNEGVVTRTVGGTYVTGEARNLTFNTNVGGSKQSSPGGGSLVNIENAPNTKAPAIRNMVTWHVTDSSQTAGYRRVVGLLQDTGNTAPGRDDDNQVRL
jgi:hypothetical protein